MSFVEEKMFTGVSFQRESGHSLRTLAAGLYGPVTSVLLLPD